MAESSIAITSNTPESAYADEPKVDTIETTQTNPGPLQSTDSIDSIQISSSSVLSNSSIDESPSPTVTQFGSINKNFHLQSQPDTINVPIFQRTDKTVFGLVTFPTMTIINSIIGCTDDGSDVLIEAKVASSYGVTQGFNFNEHTKFLPGDYCLGVVFKSPEEATKIIYLKIYVMIETISNLSMCQVLFGLYRSLGFEPSHVLKYPVKSANAGTPFYRKTRNEIYKATESVNACIDYISKLSTNTDHIYKKIVEIPTIVKEQTRFIQDKVILVHEQSKIIEEKISTSEQQAKTIQDQINGSQEQFKVIKKRIDESQERLNLIPEEIARNTIQLVNNHENKLQDTINCIYSQLNGNKIEINEVTSKLDNINLIPIQEKLNEISKGLSQGFSQKSGSALELLPEIQELQSHLSQIHKLISQPSIAEKGYSEVHSITITDFEKLIEEKDMYFNKLAEAEDHIDYLQEKLEEMEKKTHRPNFIRRTPSSKWN